MRVFATKYALTGGVREIEVSPPDGNGLCNDGGPLGGTYYRINKDCFERKADAVADAEKMRQRKIVSVKKQLAKLEAMTF